MAVKHVICKVLGHGDGPECPDCQEYMDTIEIQAPDDSSVTGKEAYYCYFCVDGKKS